MKLPQVMLSDLLWLVLIACGCSAPAVLPEPSKREVACEQSVVLASLPVNSDKRCFGIAIVMEALLATESLESQACENAASVAETLYDKAATTGQVRLPEFIESGGTRLPLLSRDGLGLLSTLIAERYKRDHTRSAAGLATEGRLASAMTAFVPSVQRLSDMLAADSDQTVAFGGLGVREFPDGEQRETSHAFVLHRQSDGQVVVHDPNDPQSPVPCRLAEDEDGVLAEWTCRYRDTGLVTTQAYHLVTVKDFLHMAFGTEPR